MLELNSRIIDRKEVAERTTEVSFERPSGFSFEAGQYFQLIALKLLKEDPRGNSRLFSIASSPNIKDRIVIVFRNTGSSYKRTLLESPLGTRVAIRGPFGIDFLLPKDAKAPAKVVFVAGGIGITPFLSMTNFAIEEKLALSITLLYANQSRESAAYMEELEKLAQINKNFVLKTKFGLVDEEFLKEGVLNLKDALWYVAGPPGMVETTITLLFNLGVDADRVRKERFTGY